MGSVAYDVQADRSFIVGLQRRSTARYQSRIPQRKEPSETRHKPTPAPAQEWKRSIHVARVLRDEAVSVSEAEPAHSAMASVLTDAAVEAQDAYNALCAKAGVCRVANCYRKAVEGGRRCRSHAPFYAKRPPQAGEMEI